jgi:hypothetical protein
MEHVELIRKILRRGNTAQQMAAIVRLIKALGGGWDGSQIPPTKDIATDRPNPAH